MLIKMLLGFVAVLALVCAILVAMAISPWILVVPVIGFSSYAVGEALLS